MPACGTAHREVVYAFPPDQLVRAVVEKAMADRALGVLLVPVAILAPHWNHLLSASILPRRPPYADGFVRIRRPDLVLQARSHTSAAELAVFARDFGRLSPRPDLPSLSSCPGASARRLRPL